MFRIHFISIEQKSIIKYPNLNQLKDQILEEDNVKNTTTESFDGKIKHLMSAIIQTLYTIIQICARDIISSD